MIDSHIEDQNKVKSASNELSTSWFDESNEQARLLRGKFEAISDQVANLHAALNKHLAEGGDLSKRRIVRSA